MSDSRRRCVELEREVRRLKKENARLQREASADRAERTELREENQRLKQRVRDLARQAWGRKSERTRPQPPPAGPRPPKASEVPRPRQKRGPKPFDPALPREIVRLPDPTGPICPVTGERMSAGFTEAIEVLVFIPAVVKIRRYERTVFVSSARSAPQFTPWPEHVFARSRVDASVMGQLAAEHYCEHQPFSRIEKRLARSGVRLSWVTQVALMKKLEKLVEPAVAELKAELMKQDYLHLDATPVPLCDPARRGGTVESTVWGYRANDEPLCWYQFCEYPGGKSPDHPDRELKAVGYRGLLQVDGAAGLSEIGTKGQVIALGCLSHARRYAHWALADGDKKAEVYLAGFNRLFRIDRLGKHFGLGPKNFHALRMTRSLPLFDLLVAMAEAEKPAVPPKTHLGDCLKYLIEQQEYLRRCITIPGAELTNNAAERCLRPLKTGIANWNWVGHPKAGPRLANLFTLIENCRQVGVDVGAYLTDLITRLPDHSNWKITELLPAAWKRARERTASAADPPAA